MTWLLNLNKDGTNEHANCIWKKKKGTQEDSILPEGLQQLRKIGNRSGFQNARAPNTSKHPLLPKSHSSQGDKSVDGKSMTFLPLLQTQYPKSYSSTVAEILVWSPLPLWPHPQRIKKISSSNFLSLTSSIIPNLTPAETPWKHTTWVGQREVHTANTFA